MRRAAGVLAASLFAVSLAAGDEVGTTGAQTFRRVVSARPAALGEAFTAMRGDIDAMSFNPAGLAKLPGPALTTTYHRAFADQNFGSLSYGHPLPFGSVFVGGGYFDAGEIELNQSDGTQGTRHAQQDTVGLAGVALGRNLPLSIGVTGKFLRSELAEAAQATVAAADAGVHWETPAPGLGLGAAVQNVGSDIKYEQEGDPLPQTVRAGFSYRLDLASLGVIERFPYQFLLVVDGVKTKEEPSAVHAGFEISRSLEMASTEGSAALRGGYRSDGGSFDVGVGFVIASVSLDYSLRLISDLDVTHRFTLGYRFSPISSRSRR